jgi:hypothetical protein
MYLFTACKLLDINIEFLSVVVFAPNESKPLFMQTLKLPSPVKSALFLPLEEVKNSQISWQKQAVLYFATENQVCGRTCSPTSAYKQNLHISGNIHIDQKQN